jgi:hypothetical protein
VGASKRYRTIGLPNPSKSGEVRRGASAPLSRRRHRRLRRPVEAGRSGVIATAGPERGPGLRAVRRSGRQATGGGAAFLANSGAA